MTLNSPEVRVILIEATAKGQHHHARTLAAIGLAQIDVVEGGEENANDFENGILTRYTCAYGLGPFMKRFVFMVKGETMAGEAQRDDKWPVNFE